MIGLRTSRRERGGSILGSFPIVIGSCPKGRGLITSDSSEKCQRCVKEESLKKKKKIKS